MPIDFSFDVDIDRPPQEVFSVVADPARLSDWQAAVVEVERLDEEPMRQGSRLREVPLTFSPAGDGGTRLRIHAHGSARGPLRLLGPLLTLGLKREFRKQYGRLQELVERGA